MKRSVEMTNGPAAGRVYEIEAWVASLVIPSWIDSQRAETWTYREQADGQWVGEVTVRQFFPVIENPDPDFKPEVHECDCAYCGWDNW